MPQVKDKYLVFHYSPTSNQDCLQLFALVTLEKKKKRKEKQHLYISLKYIEIKLVIR